ncbi:hypothetical protein [Nocardioides sp. Root151]|uniref:hypothetical protein n=1 Tax=Nocardioides sp. Root151 TaxID=1736475 RepID=UPI0007028A6E|nr:hypothetical protein [Nocardioides sp. Root151]KQZ75825.1 hypothetical protein ASD66_05760 [Nocardioides sp. Root151]
MSGATRPRGPLPARVYWVRRALVLGTAFLLIFGFARLLGSGNDGDGGSEGSGTPVAEQAAGDPTDRPSADTTPTTTAKPKKTRTPLPQPDGPCSPDDITVEPDLDRVAADGSIEIPFLLSGTDEACTFQVSNSTMVIKITSGSDLIWTSQECAKVPSEDVVVRSATSTRIVLVWNGRRSDDDCSRTAKWATAGWYHVEAAALGGEPTSDKFELVNPKPKTVYKTEKPKPKKKSSDKTSEKPSSSASSSPSGAVEPN